MNIHGEIIRELYSDEDIYKNFRGTSGDVGYPHTNLEEKCVEAVAKETNPKFWLEVGSMLGGSAIRTAVCLKNRGVDCKVICVDPFCGDVNMWAWERGLRAENGWRFLGLRDGGPTIRERFMSNVCLSKMEDMICPISTTGIVGMKLLNRLLEEQRISSRPEVIYLDAAHEEHETFLEMMTAWNLMHGGGVLFGDDWGWGAVQSDALRFARIVKIDKGKSERIRDYLGENCTIEDGVVVWKGIHWFICKE